MVAVIVDLSQPADTLRSAVLWLQLVKTKLQHTYDWLEHKGSKLPEQLRLRARKYIGSSHEDKDTIQHLGTWCQTQHCHREWLHVCDDCTATKFMVTHVHVYHYTSHLALAFLQEVS